MLRKSRSRPGLRQTVALLAAYLVAVQAIFGVLAPPTSLATGAVNAIICHNTDGIGDPSQSPAIPAGTCNHCTLCHVISSAALPPPVTMLRPIEVRRVDHGPRATDAPRPATERPFSARAPPGVM